MLTKLLKHEFIATARIMWIIYAAMVVLSVLANVSIRLLSRDGMDFGFVHVLLIMALVLWVIVLFLSLVVTFILMLRRFQKNLLTEEGYLMFTLPSGVHELLIAKLIVAAVWMIASLVMVALCVGLAVVSTAALRDVAELIRTAYREITVQTGLNITMVLLEILLTMIVSICVAYLQFYSAMAIGHGFSNHKALWSVAAYFIQSIVISVLSNVIFQVVLQTGYWENVTWDMAGMQWWHLTVLGTVVINVVVGAVFYALTAWNLKNRLNLA